MYSLYSNLSSPIKASIWFTICSVLQKGIGLLTMPIFTRLLTTEQYGLFTVYNSWYAIISVIATLNLSEGVYNNGLTKFSNDRKKYTSSLQGLSTFLTTILLIIYLINIKFWNSILELSTFFMILMFAEMYFVPAYSFWVVGQRYNYKYKKLVIVTLLITISIAVSGIIGVSLTVYKAEARVFTNVLVYVLVGMIFYIYNLYKGKALVNAKYWKFAFRFNIFLVPHYLSMTILNQADRIMISQMAGKHEAAIYSVAYTVSSIMTIVTSAINSSFIPFTYKALKGKDYKAIGKNANSLLILVGGMCVLAMAFGPEIVGLFATSEYYDAIWIIPPVATSVYFIFLYPLFGNIEFYFEKTKYIAIASCCGAILNIVLNYIFINIFGYYAAGYTTLACYIIFSFAHYYFYKKILKEELPYIKIYNVRIILGISISLLIMMVIMTVTYKYRLLRYSIIFILLVIAIIKRKKIKELMLYITKN